MFQKLKKKYNSLFQMKKHQKNRILGDIFLLAGLIFIFKGAFGLFVHDYRAVSNLFYGGGLVLLGILNLNEVF